MNLMVINHGAIGDTIYLVPALEILRTEYDVIGMLGRNKGLMALENSGLVDYYIVAPRAPQIPKNASSRLRKQLTEKHLAKKRLVLTEHAKKVTYQHKCDTSGTGNKVGTIVGRYVFHLGSDDYSRPQEWKIERNRGVNYFDAMSSLLKVYDENEDLVRDGVPEAVGKRPSVNFTRKESYWVKQFRSDLGIPEEAFLIGWQFGGSVVNKWYPYFKEVIQDAILPNHPDVYVLGLGDLKNNLQTKHIRRFVNVGDTLSFREVWVAMSTFDLLVSPDTGMFCASQVYETLPKILLPSMIDGSQVCFGDDSIILSPTTRCHPCFNLGNYCEVRRGNRKRYGTMCITSIKPKRVIRAIEEVIANAV